jgi:hypothetical protein
MNRRNVVNEVEQRRSMQLGRIMKIRKEKGIEQRNEVIPLSRSIGLLVAPSTTTGAAEELPKPSHSLRRAPCRQAERREWRRRMHGDEMMRWL